MNDFDHIKERLDLFTVITQETGLFLKGHHLSECPFCNGHECFSIKNNHYKCYQCPDDQSSGDVFTFLQKYKNFSSPQESLKYAADLAGIKLTEKKKAEVKLSTKERIFIEAANYYHGHMLDNGGKQYLITQRGHGEDVLRRMRVGWTDGGLVEHLRQKGFDDIEIKVSGLAKPMDREGTEFLVDYFIKDVAIFPHLDIDRVLHFTIKDPNKKYRYQLLERDRFKDWKFYNQAAIDKYKEIIVVEGENDLLSVLDAGIENVIGLIGQPADYQLKALQNYCRKKHLYLWLDNDEPGKNYIRKISTTLKTNVRIIPYPEEFKDPDEYIRRFDGDRKKNIKQLLEESLDYISWEIKEISKLESLEERLKTLKERKIFMAVADMVEVEKLVYIEKLSALGFTQSSLEQQIEVNHDLRNTLSIYFESLPSKKEADPNHIVLEIFKSLSETGRFYRDRMADTHLMYQHHIYQISNNRPFNALIKRITGLLPTKEPGRSVWESLASEAYTSGMQIDLASWLHTDRANDAIYINFNSPNNVILKITKSEVEEVPNGMNKEGILLKSSKKILPVNFHPDADIKEGISILKELVFDNLTCEKEQRYLILCWFISTFLLDFAPYMGLMKFSGPTSSGKTTAARLLSILIYGNEHLGDPSTAAAYAVSSQNPLLIIDNLESDDFTKSTLKFLLLSATKGSKEKRTQGTELDTTQETPKALVLITAIEPFTKAELINRTYDLDFDSKYKTDNFIEDEVIRSLIKKRDLIISSLLKFISKDILPNLERRKDFITVLKKQHKNHAKNRTDEYLALLMLMLEKILNYIPYYEKDTFLEGMPNEIEEAERDIRTAWIEYQNTKARDTETSSNSIIKLLDGLVREYIQKMKDLSPEIHKDYQEEVYVYQHQEYLLEMIRTKSRTYCNACHGFISGQEGKEGEEICECKGEQSHEVYSKLYFEYIATAGEVVHAFDRYCRNNGIKNPYETESIFAARLRNDRHLLKKGAWDLVVKEEKNDPYFRILHGRRFYKFRKALVR